MCHLYSVEACSLWRARKSLNHFKLKSVRKGNSGDNSGFRG